MGKCFYCAGNRLKLGLLCMQLCMVGISDVNGGNYVIKSVISV